MIRVAQVVEDLRTGGLERVIEQMAISLDPVKFEVSVLCLKAGGEIADQLEASKGNVEVLGIENFHSLAGLSKVRKWFRNRQIDVVHTHGYPAGVLGRLAAIFAGVPHLIHHVHSTYINLNRRNHLIEKFLSGFTYRVICCSKAVRRFVSEQEGIRSDRLMVIHNGVPDPKTEPAAELERLKSSLSIPTEARVIGCVASLVRHKGHRYLIEAASQIENVILVLVGDGPLREELEGLVAKLGIDGRVVFAGYQSDVTPYLQLMDVFILPSIEREGLGIAIIEAMALAKPVVASRLGGITEVVDDGRTGLLVPPGDSDALTAAIKRLLQSTNETDAMRSLARKRYLENFALKQMIGQIELLYESSS